MCLSSVFFFSFFFTVYHPVLLFGFIHQAWHSSWTLHVKARPRRKSRVRQFSQNWVGSIYLVWQLQDGIWLLRDLRPTLFFRENCLTWLLRGSFTSMCDWVSSIILSVCCPCVYIWFLVIEFSYVVYKEPFQLSTLQKKITLFTLFSLLG